MTPADLHAWLVARWQEKLGTARAATLGPWDRSFTSLRMDGSGSARIAPVTGGPAVALAHFRNGADPDHIVAFDPAFAIAVCEAALRRLARHAPGEDCNCCPWCSQGHELLAVWPCPEVLDDAAPFAARDDFPEELRHGHGS